MGNSTRAAINVTPMIDVLLVLLIIFMAISPQKPVGLDALLPRNEPTPGLPSENPIFLQIAADRTLQINSERISRGALHNRLAEIFSKRAHRLLFLRADSNLEFATIADALDEARSAGIDHVALDTAGRPRP